MWPVGAGLSDYVAALFPAVPHTAGWRLVLALAAIAASVGCSGGASRRAVIAIHNDDPAFSPKRR